MRTRLMTFALTVLALSNSWGCRTTTPVAKTTASTSAACNFLYPFLFYLPLGTEAILPSLVIKAAAFGAAYGIQTADGCNAQTVASISQESLSDIAKIIADEDQTDRLSDYQNQLQALVQKVKDYRIEPVSPYAPQTALSGMWSDSEGLVADFNATLPVSNVIRYVTAAGLRLRINEEYVRANLAAALYAKQHNDDYLQFITAAKSYASSILNMVGDSQKTIAAYKAEVPDTVKSWFTLNKTLQKGRQCLGYYSDPAKGIDLDTLSSCQWAACYDVKSSPSDSAQIAAGDATDSIKLRAQYAKSSVCWASQISNAPSLSISSIDQTTLDQLVMPALTVKLGRQLTKDLFLPSERPPTTPTMPPSTPGDSVTEYLKAAQVVAQTMTALIAITNPDDFFVSDKTQIPASLQSLPDMTTVVLPLDPPPACGLSTNQYATVLARVSVWNGPNWTGDAETLELSDLFPVVGMGVYPHFGGVGSAKVTCLAPNYEVTFSQSFSTTATSGGARVDQSAVGDVADAGNYGIVGALPIN